MVPLCPLVFVSVTGAYRKWKWSNGVPVPCLCSCIYMYSTMHNHYNCLSSASRFAKPLSQRLREYHANRGSNCNYQSNLYLLTTKATITVEHSEGSGKQRTGNEMIPQDGQSFRLVFFFGTRGFSADSPVKSTQHFRKLETMCITIFSVHSVLPLY